ncbi:hydroxymethylbilane synthase [Chthonomonas calidirosea]|uniref:hydroxymethylbilane synthase n=1 Tax=Chthonomonas calidirosea TaxID=454171 RepID=UPI0006DD4DA2|nr:hydroxymethylbilane synthase [Chthonomonas calidirosea]CEK12815.1 hydroxymethylbilane synthase [Chthonomonas calidirosea]
METPIQKVRFGTRGSLLARTQTQWVAHRFQRLYPQIEVELVVIETTGDKQRDRPFTAVGTKGMFVKEIEEALLQGTIDVGVHSAKDLPSELPNGLSIICIPPREAPYDVLIAREARSLEQLPAQAVIGTSSLRRRAQIASVRPDLRFVELRGNLDTRLRKLKEGQCDALVLAYAGLHRLGAEWEGRITQILPKEVCLPAPGQGALAIEAREDREDLRALFSALHCTDSACTLEAERSFQAALGGGCTVPIGALASLEGPSAVVLEAVVVSPDGRQRLFDTYTGLRSRAREVGATLARRMLERGAKALIEAHR